MLANVAEVSHSYSNALYYKEKEFRLSCLVMSTASSSRRLANNHRQLLYSSHRNTRHHHHHHHHHHSNTIDQSIINAKFNQSYSITAELLLK